MKRVEVEWRDSMGTGRWENRKGLLERSSSKDWMNCRSCGYLLDKQSDRIILSLSLTEDEESVDSTLTIPAEAVTKITLLRGGGK